MVPMFFFCTVEQNANIGIIILTVQKKNFLYCRQETFYGTRFLCTIKIIMSIFQKYRKKLLILLKTRKEIEPDMQLKQKSTVFLHTIDLFCLLF